MFINDIETEIWCSINLFADDTTIYMIVENINNATENLNTDLKFKFTLGLKSGWWTLIRKNGDFINIMWTRTKYSPYLIFW